MKDVYVFFISSEFKTGKMISFVTRNRYSHVALSFQPDASVLYSYSRYRYSEPFLSGFGIEYTDRYTQDVPVKVCRYSVSDEQYQRIWEHVQYYCRAKDETRYNFADLLAYPFNKHFNMKLTHTCISFLLETLEITDLHTIVQLESRLHDTVVYEGPLSGVQEKSSVAPDNFYERRNPLWVTVRSASVLGQQLAFVCEAGMKRLLAH